MKWTSKLIILAGAAQIFGATALASQKPNILFLFVDDLGYGDISAYNPESKIQTPNIDKLAAEGILFLDGHSAATVCTPSRYSALTGRYCWRTDLKAGIVRNSGDPLIKQDRLTISEMLQQNGYRTGMVGKWHLGRLNVRKEAAPEYKHLSKKERAVYEVDWSQKMEVGPMSYGFDYTYGMAKPSWCFFENDTPLGLPEEEFSYEKESPGVRYIKPREGEILGGHATKGLGRPGYSHEQLLENFTQKACEFIETSVKGGTKPFFLYWSPMAPHTPISPSEAFVGKSQAGLYGDFVVELDDCVGRILKKLDEVGARDNTLVLFTSDNGPEFFARKRKKNFNHDSSGGLKGSKRDLWEGGHRVPFITRWPDVSPAGVTSKQTVGSIDLMATAAELVGYPFKENEAEDSFSLLDVLKDPESPVRDSMVYHGSQGHVALRQGSWVYLGTKDLLGRDKTFKKMMEHTEGPAEVNGILYNLEKDPLETKNFVAEYPEVSARMQAELDQLIKSVRTAPLSSEKQH
jgi:arylsulfatase A-like enzyme